MLSLKFRARPLLSRRNEEKEETDKKKLGTLISSQFNPFEVAYHDSILV